MQTLPQLLRKQRLRLPLLRLLQKTAPRGADRPGGGQTATALGQEARRGGKEGRAREAEAGKAARDVTDSGGQKQMLELHEEGRFIRVQVPLRVRILLEAQTR